MLVTAIQALSCEVDGGALYIEHFGHCSAEILQWNQLASTVSKTTNTTLKSNNRWQGPEIYCIWKRKKGSQIEKHFFFAQHRSTWVRMNWLLQVFMLGFPKEQQLRIPDKELHPFCFCPTFRKFFFFLPTPFLPRSHFFIFSSYHPPLLHIRSAPFLPHSPLRLLLSSSTVSSSAGNQEFSASLFGSGCSKPK